jgi:hypothetical protein
LSFPPEDPPPQAIRKSSEALRSNDCINFIIIEPGIILP